jgi:hypothetical protein
MGPLAEYVQKEAEQLRKEAHRQEEAVKEWEEAVSRLYERLAAWVTAADGGNHLLRVTKAGGPIIQEPRLGLYEFDNLVISLGSRRIIVAPRARYVVATIKPPGKDSRRADGTVEIRGGSVIDYHLFRLKEADGDHWYIQSDARWHADPRNNDVEELNSDRFEAAILRVLQ